MTKTKYLESREGRTWPAYLFGGRFRTSTLGLIVAFMAIWWLYETYQPAPTLHEQIPAVDVVPPGFVPDPSYTWVPRTDVQRNFPTSVTPTTTETTTETSPTTSPTTSGQGATTPTSSAQSSSSNTPVTPTPSGTSSAPTTPAPTASVTPSPSSTAAPMPPLTHPAGPLHSPTPAQPTP